MSVFLDVCPYLCFFSLSLFGEKSPLFTYLSSPHLTKIPITLKQPDQGPPPGVLTDP